MKLKQILYKKLCEGKPLQYAIEGILDKYTRPNMTTGGTCNARYCYSVWMRHLKYYYDVKQDIPEIIAEFGPGDTIGIGLTALLCGAENYYALDFARYSGMNEIEDIFDELLKLLQTKAEIPGDEEFPEVYPKLKSYAFPKDILTDERLENCLESKRIDRIRNAVSAIEQGEESEMIHYLAPWWKENVQNIQCDMVYSQAVFEHIDEYENAHKVIGEMMKAGAVVAHQIDFRSHGCAKEWNGHWAYGKLMWKLVYGTRPYCINREPLNMHIREMQRAGIEINRVIRVQREDGIPHKKVCRKYQSMSEKDLKTASAYIIGVKK